MQRRGNHDEALFWFRQVADMSAGRLLPFVEAVLPDQDEAPDFGRQEDWYGDALNPHTIASTRSGVHVRFVLLSIVRCLLDYADAEFTIDTSESLARAREKYATARRMLDSDVLTRGAPGCAELIGELTIRIGEDHWRRIVIDVVRDLVGDALDDIPAGFDPSVTADKVNELVDPRNPQPEIEKRDAIRQLLTEQLAAPPTSTVDDRRRIGRERRAAVFGRLLDDRTIFTMVQQASPGRRPRSARRATRLIVGGAVGVPVGRPELEGSVREVFVPAPAFEFCVPRNPMAEALRLRAKFGQFKLDHCLNVVGVQREIAAYDVATDARSELTSIDGISRTARPPTPRLQATPYRYRTLVERTRELAEMARQMESSLLGLLQQRDLEAYNVLRAQQDLELAGAAVTLQDLRRAEADSQRELARLQRERVEAVRDHYQEMLDAGLLGTEAIALGFLVTGALIQNAITIAGLAASGGASAAFSGLVGGVGTLGTGALPAAVVGGLLGAAGGALAGSIVTGGAGLVTASSVFSMLASYERRAEEWQLQRDLAADHDLPIAEQQELVADNRVEIARQEYTAARLSTDHARDVLSYLHNKFTDVELFDWMSGVVGGVYRYFLEQATSMARIAEAQLAFERQEPPTGIILGDYWTLSGLPDGTGGGTQQPDRQGLTGSARLLKDIARLDQQAFLTDQRKLQISRTLSLATLDPIAFQQFQESGVLRFATPLELFDRDFPGHYLRLVKRVRLSVIALIPPSAGIHATLSTGGLSYVVRGRDVFERVAIVRPPETVALSGAMNATGLFDLQEQTDMLLPFEGSGVEASWELCLPRAANLFDFSTIADVLLSIDYTALDSVTYRHQVLAELRPTVSADRAFSLRQHLPDVWYDLHNPDLVDPALRMKARFDTRRTDFLPNVADPLIEQVTVYLACAADVDRTLEIQALQFTPSGGEVATGGPAIASNGLVGTRQGNADRWQSIVGLPAVGSWELSLPDTAAMRDRFVGNQIDDLLFVVTYGGTLPAWPT